MNVVDIAVLVGAVLATGGLAWFFFGPRPSSTTDLHGGVQEIEITVKGVSVWCYEDQPLAPVGPSPPSPCS